MPSLDYIVDEMRYREHVQDEQVSSLATKAATLFTTAVAATGLAAAIAARRSVDARSIDSTLLGSARAIILLLCIGAIALFLWRLIESFHRAYLVQPFERSPDPGDLWTLVRQSEAQTKYDVTDGRRYAIQKNERIVVEQARNVQLMQRYLVRLSIGLLLFLWILSIGWMNVDDIFNHTTSQATSGNTTTPSPINSGN